MNKWLTDIADLVKNTTSHIAYLKSFTSQPPAHSVKLMEGLLKLLKGQEEENREGPAPIIDLSPHCKGCKYLQTKYWSEELENDDRDSGTTARCTLVTDPSGSDQGKCIDHYWSARTKSPDWCPFLQHSEQDEKHAI